MKNTEMQAGRFLRWHAARKFVAEIKTHLANGGQVMVANHYHATIYKAKHIEFFKAARDGAVLVRSGKQWNCIANFMADGRAYGCAIRFSKPAPVAV